MSAQAIRLSGRTLRVRFSAPDGIFGKDSALAPAVAVSVAIAAFASMKAVRRAAAVVVRSST